MAGSFESALTLLQKNDQKNLTIHFELAKAFLRLFITKVKNYGGFSQKDFVLERSVQMLHDTFEPILWPYMIHVLGILSKVETELDLHRQELIEICLTIIL